MYSSEELYDEDLSPVNNVEMVEIPSSDTHIKNFKRDAAPIIYVIRDILDKFYVSPKIDQKRAQFEESR